MPEGDTIYRAAQTLRGAVEGRRIEDPRSRGELSDDELDRLGGREIEEVEARGKHLMMHLDDGQVIHSHMGMTGSWHLYAVGDPWRKPASRAAVSMRCGEQVAVCFTPKLLELLTAKGFQRHRYIHRLGPDILGRRLDIDEVLRRFRVCDHLPLGEVVLNQTVLCGIGNVYKSEVLFLQQLDPFQSVSLYDNQQLSDVVTESRKLMRLNLDGHPRRTRFAGRQRLWVYKRQGKPCFRCGHVIRMRRQGDLGRSTYYCPQCQGA